ncbi:hypothetical protein [Cupriavidus gilardii]|uniref:hypothetical protein n=1 Tax=Cupriavidus gilardii TaxID=82541 RepID=UPI001EE57B10|nr:hypothetical protein [Cupriavidus gilardii]MCG5263129.1 hypothetical protein [Cupriavidus gilardii]
MSTIVAGRFDSFADAERAARGLYGHGFSVWDVSIFTVGTPQPAQELARPPGVLLAARVEPERLQTAAELIRLEGGRELEQAEGQWENGRWSDFDPMSTPQPLQETAPHERAGQLGEGALSATGNEDPGSEIDQSVRQDEDRHAGQGAEAGEAGAADVAGGNGERDLGVLLTPGQHTTTHEGVSKGDEARMQGQRAGEPRQQGATGQAPSGGQESSQGAGQGASQGAGQGQTQGQREGQGQHPAEEQPREAWESAQSHRQPGEKSDEPELVRGATTTPEPSGPNDTFRQIRRGQFPPGVGEGDLRDPGSTTPDAPKVDNRS